MNIVADLVKYHILAYISISRPIFKTLRVSTMDTTLQAHHVPQAHQTTQQFLVQVATSKVAQVICISSL